MLNISGLVYFRCSYVFHIPVHKNVKVLRKISLADMWFYRDNFFISSEKSISNSARTFYPGHGPQRITIFKTGLARVTRLVYL